MIINMIRSAFSLNNHEPAVDFLKSTMAGSRKQSGAQVGFSCRFLKRTSQNNFRMVPSGS